MVEDVHLDAGADQCGGDVRLQVREAEYEIRLERDDAIDFRRRECRNLRLLATRSRRPHREAGDADDAPLLAEQVQGFRRLLRETDDPFGK